MKWIRCPVCGKKARPMGIGRAGKHLLGVLTLKGLGKGKGFKHIWKEIPLELLRALKDALELALNQVIAEIEVREYLETLQGEKIAYKPIKVKIKEVSDGDKDRQKGSEKIIPIIRAGNERIYQQDSERITIQERERISVRISDM